MISSFALSKMPFLYKDRLCVGSSCKRNLCVGSFFLICLGQNLILYQNTLKGGDVNGRQAKTRWY